MSLKNLFGILGGSEAKPKGVKTIYDYTVKNIKEEPFNLADLKGKVVLIVNVASQCGFTPQYKGLQEVYGKYHDKGLEIIGFPCNQFGAQEPGKGGEITEFCERKFKVTFPLMDKIDVNGEAAEPLYKFLKSEKKSALFAESIMWNFEKFLIKRNGTVYARYISTTTPETIASDIEKLLAEPDTTEPVAEPTSSL